MKKFGMIAGLMLVTSGAYANPYTPELATVIGATEVMSVRNVPQQQCSTVSVPIYGHQSSNGGVIGDVVDGTFGSTEGLVGAIVGGVAGSYIGKGSGRRWATAGGAILGSQIANRKYNNQNNIVGYQQQQQCQTVFVSEQYVSGYNVMYDLDGHRFTQYEHYKPIIGSRHEVIISTR